MWERCLTNMKNCGFFSCENSAINFKQKTDYAKLCRIGCFCCIRCRKTHDFAEGRRFRFNGRPFFPKSFFFPKIIFFFQKSFNEDLGARQTPSADFTERVFFLVFTGSVARINFSKPSTASYPFKEIARPKLANRRSEVSALWNLAVWRLLHF